MIETRFGKCQWCERHNQVLHSVVGQHDGQLWCGWICYECLVAAQQKDWGKQKDDERSR